MAGTKMTKKNIRQKTRILVTGGSGRIGRRLVQRLVGAGDDVTVVDSRHGDGKGVKYLTIPISYLKINDVSDFDVVYHLAASIDYKASKKELWARNVAPAAILLDICKACKQFIFMSSTSVYAEDPRPLTEDSQVKPGNNYGWSKLECEKLIQKSDIPYTIIRSSQVYGPDFEEGYAQVLKKIQRSEMRIIGDGDNHIPLVHVDDLVDALLIVKGKREALGRILNVDGGYGKTQLEFMETAAGFLGVNPPDTKINPKVAKIFGRLTGRGAVMTEYIDKMARDRQISIARAKELGYAPKVTLEAGMKEVIEAFRARGLLD